MVNHEDRWLGIRAAVQSVHLPQELVIRVDFNSTGEWLDPRSIRFWFQLNNTYSNIGQRLRTIADPLAVLSWLRILISSVVAEGIVEYGRAHTLVQTITSTVNKEHDNIEGFGGR